MLYPSRLLFNIPLRDPLVGDDSLSSNFLILNCYSSSILHQALNNREPRESKSTTTLTKFFRNATNESLAGSESAVNLAAHLCDQPFKKSSVTKDGFVQTPPSSDAVHFHGHVATEEHQINHMTIFYGSVPLQAHEVFSQNPTKHHSLMFSSAVLVLCGNWKLHFEYCSCFVESSTITCGYHNSDYHGSRVGELLGSFSSTSMSG